MANRASAGDEEITRCTDGVRAERLVRSNAGAGGLLPVFADSLDNTITVSRNAAGAILVNGGAVGVAGGQPTVANAGLIQVFGLGGNDTLTLSETSGALPRAAASR